jgi:hypothetical protein
MTIKVSQIEIDNFIGTAKYRVARHPNVPVPMVTIFRMQD